MTVPEDPVDSAPLGAGAVQPNGASASATWEPPPEQWRDRTRLWQVLTVGFALLCAALAFLLLRPEGTTSYAEAPASSLACEVLQMVQDGDPSAPAQDSATLTRHRLTAVQSLARVAALEDVAASDLHAALDQPVLLATQGRMDAPEFGAAVEEALSVCAVVDASG